jgi:DNA repair protein RecO (recombination protein O)
VLRSIKLGETDRIVTVLSRGHGKIRAVAKGVRKPGSRFGARLEPTSNVVLQCYRGRSELDVVTQVETIDSNRRLREHYGCLTHAVSMLEAKQTQELTRNSPDDVAPARHNQ